MSFCEQIEKYLWDLEGLPEHRRSEIQAHLSQCEKCRKALETISALKAHSERDREILSSVNAEQFDSGVMRKIQAARRVPVEAAGESRRYMFRMAFSFAAAAAIVLFLVKSMSDLGPPLPPREAAPSPEVQEGKEYGVINLEMRLKEETPPKMEKKASAPEEQVFSILPSPVTTPAPESINIGAVFVASDNIPMAKQTREASLADLYSDTGSFQSALPQSSVLVTVEKMPNAVSMAMPEYPVWAKKRGYSGSVWVKARVEADGSVSQALVASCDMPGVGFEEAAVNAALKSRFLPASSNGKNFAVWVIYPVKFIFKKQG